MPEPERYTAVRYLTAKEAVDDDALNTRVFNAFEQGIAAMGSRDLRVIELGAGVGSTFRRLHASGIVSRGEYVLVDLDADSLAEASRVVDEILGPTERAELSADFIVGDAVTYLKREAEADRRADVIIAQALIDLLNVPEFLGAAVTAFKPGGYLYMPITFDGETVFGPPIDAELDKGVVAAYHATMDARRMPDGLPTGGSKTGRTLLHELPRAGLEIVQAGSSDWVVFPRDGAYRRDVAYFLHHIINFVWESLREGGEIPVNSLQGWVAARHAQVERGELVYIAHQLDVLARKPK